MPRHSVNRLLHTFFAIFFVVSLTVQLILGNFLLNQASASVTPPSKFEASYWSKGNTGIVECTFKAGTIQNFNERSPDAGADFVNDTLSTEEQYLPNLAWYLNSGSVANITNTDNLPVNAIFGGDTGGVNVENEQESQTNDDIFCARFAYLEQSDSNKLEFKGKIAAIDRDCGTVTITAKNNFDPNSNVFKANVSKLPKADCSDMVGVNTEFDITLVQGKNGDFLGAGQQTPNTPLCSGPFSRNCWGAPGNNGQPYVCADGTYIPAPANPATCPGGGGEEPPEGTLLPIEQYTNFYWVDSAHIGRGRSVSAVTPTGSFYTKTEIVETYESIGIGASDESHFRLASSEIVDRQDLVGRDTGRGYNDSICSPKFTTNAEFSFENNPFNNETEEGAGDFGDLKGYIEKQNKKINEFVEIGKQGTGCQVITTPQGIEGQVIGDSSNSTILFNYYKDSGLASLVWGETVLKDVDGNEQGLTRPFNIKGEGANQVFLMDPQPCHLFPTQIVPKNIGSKNYKTGDNITDKSINDATISFVQGCAGDSNSRSAEAVFDIKFRYIGTGVAPTFPVDDGNDSITVEDNCESWADFAFSFVLCPILELSDEIIGWVDKRILSALSIDNSYYNSIEIKAAWGNIRNIALIVLIPMMLVMVIGTALQFSFLDAYTVKKALPRMFIGILFISLSYELSTIVIEIADGVGRGVGGLIAAPFGGFENLTLSHIFDPSSSGAAGRVGNTVFSGSVILGAIGVAFFSGVTIWSLFMFLGGAALTLFIIFLLLSVREMMVVFLVIVSPLAIIAWIFPGNDKPWKLWWSTFSKMLLLFPIIMAALAVGRGFASVADVSGDDDGGITTIVRLVAFIGPYFFIPKAFQMAGGAFASLAGMANDRSKGLFDRMKKSGAESRKNARGKNAAGDRFNRAQAKGGWVGKQAKRFNDLGRNTSSQLDAIKAEGLLHGSNKKSRDAARRAAQAAHRPHVMEDAAVKENIGNDQFDDAVLLISQGADNDTIRAYFERQGYSMETFDATVGLARNLYAKHGHALVSMMPAAKAGAKTSYQGGIREMNDDILDNSHGDELEAIRQLMGARQAAIQAGMFTLGGGSTGEAIGLLMAQQRARRLGDGERTAAGETISYRDELTGRQEELDVGGKTQDEILKMIEKRQASKAVDGMGTWDVPRMHATDAKRAVSYMHAEMDDAMRQVEEADTPEKKQAALRLLGQKITKYRSFQATVNNSGSDEVKRIVADGYENIPVVELDISGNPVKDAQGNDKLVQNPAINLPSINGEQGASLGSISEVIKWMDAVGAQNPERLTEELQAVIGGAKSVAGQYDPVNQGQRQYLENMQKPPEKP